MINPSNMLDCAAAHLLSAPAGNRIHITDMQLMSSQMDPVSLKAWADGKGIAFQPADFRGYSGVWLSIAPTPTTSTP